MLDECFYYMRTAALVGNTRKSCETYDFSLCEVVNNVIKPSIILFWIWHNLLKCMKYLEYFKRCVILDV